MLKITLIFKIKYINPPPRQTYDRVKFLKIDQYKSKWLNKCVKVFQNKKYFFLSFLSQLQIWSFRQLAVLTTDLLSCAESPRWFVILWDCWISRNIRAVRLSVSSYNYYLLSFALSVILTIFLCNFTFSENYNSIVKRWFVISYIHFRCFTMIFFGLLMGETWIEKVGFV